MKQIEITNIEKAEYCILDLETGEKRFNDEKINAGFTGLFYKNNEIFFVLYPSTEGPMIYYDNKTYHLSPDLTIRYLRSDNKRKFIIKEYNITIKYEKSKFTGFDSWSNEEDIDLFYQIYKGYKRQEFISKYTPATVEYG